MWTNYPENLLETLDTAERGQPLLLWHNVVWVALGTYIFIPGICVYFFFFFSFSSTLIQSGSYLWGWNNIRSDLLTVLQFPGSQNMVERPDLTLFLATQIGPRGGKGRSPLKNIIININNEVFRSGGSSCGVWIYRLIAVVFLVPYILLAVTQAFGGWMSPSISVLKPTNPKLDPICRQTLVRSCVSRGPCGSGIGLCCQVSVGSHLISGLDPPILTCSCTNQKKLSA